VKKTALLANHVLFGIGAALMGAAVIIALITGPRTVETVPASGSVVLPKGGEAMTVWVEVPVDHQVRWDWEADAYIDFEVEARPYGIIDGGDTGGGNGCARAELPFALRIWWGHTAFPSQNGPAIVQFNITVENLDTPCPTVAELSQERGIVPASETLPPPRPLVSLFPIAIATAGGAVSLVAAFRERDLTEEFAARQAHEREPAGDPASPGPPPPLNRRSP
jgi:hypothetical protein